MGDGGVDSSLGNCCVTLELSNHSLLLPRACTCVGGRARARAMTVFVQSSKPLEYGPVGSRLVGFGARYDRIVV